MKRNKSFKGGIGTASVFVHIFNLHTNHQVLVVD